MYFLVKIRVQPSLCLHPFSGYMIFIYFQSAHIHHYENCLVGTSNPETYLFFPISFLVFIPNHNFWGCPLIQVKITGPLLSDVAIYSFLPHLSCLTFLRLVIFHFLFYSFLNFVLNFIFYCSFPLWFLHCYCCF